MYAGLIKFDNPGFETIIYFFFEGEGRGGKNVSEKLWTCGYGV